MSNLVGYTHLLSKARNKVNIMLSILIVLCIGTVLWAYSAQIPWYLAVAIAAFTIALGISGQLILFLLAYKVWERWIRKQCERELPSFRTFVHVIFNGYIRSLWFFFAITLLISIFHASLPEVLKTFAFVFMGANIFITFLSSNPRTWDENTDVPTVLGIGYSIQLLFLLVVKLIV